MIIERVYNNNVVLVKDEQSQKELILTGCGIGFQKKIGQIADESKIEKKFIAEDVSFRNKISKLSHIADDLISGYTGSIVSYSS